MLPAPAHLVWKRVLQILQNQLFAIKAQILIWRSTNKIDKECIDIQVHKRIVQILMYSWYNQLIQNTKFEE